MRARLGREPPREGWYLARCPRCACYVRVRIVSAGGTRWLYCPICDRVPLHRLTLGKRER